MSLIAAVTSRLRRPLGRGVRAALGHRYWGRMSWSQEGEDLLVDKLLARRTPGFYVEVGAHHPFRFSNTWFFYRKGWRGICIDPLPGVKELFARWRERDTFLELGVAGVESSSTLTYHMFEEPAYNTFDPELARFYEQVRGARKVRCVERPVRSLADILREHLPAGQAVDFLSVDVEGLDLEVLKSCDWTCFRPRLIVVEVLQRLGRMTDGLAEDPVSAILKENGYRMRAWLDNSVIFMDEGTVSCPG